ncbi:MAG: dipeptidase, partial [Trueperaceae bacterium]
MKQSFENYLDEHKDKHLEDFFTFLRFASVSASSSHTQDIQDCAAWLAQRLSAAGFKTELLPIFKHPVVYGEWLEHPDAPTVLVYGHYDVMPAGDETLWHTPPFEPTLKDKKIYARGASDMKGNLLTALFAAEALLKTSGQLPVNVRFLFEGDEEVGSRNLENFIATNKEKLACDVVLNLDGGQVSSEQPILSLGARGLCGLELELTLCNTDLHSGMYGGAVHNPLHALAKLVSSFHDDAGHVAVKGFYDDVLEVSQEERALSQDAAKVFETNQQRLELKEFYGEQAFNPLERTTLRPSLDVNGMWGGYQGEGGMTVIPSKAYCKLTCRLVANQNPEKILELLEQHIHAHTPSEVSVRVMLSDDKAEPYLIPFNHPANRIAEEVFARHYSKAPLVARSGGSVPILAMMLKHLGVYSVEHGFSQDDECIHAPNEFLWLSSFEKAPYVWA